MKLTSIKLIATLILSSSLLGCAHSDPWTTRDTWMQVGVTTMLVADAITTSRIQDAPGVYEAGPLASKVLGSQPSTSDTYLYFGTIIITNYFITRALPAKWRPYWQGWEIAVHGYAVHNNCSKGLC